MKQEDAGHGEQHQHHHDDDVDSEEDNDEEEEVLHPSLLPHENNDLMSSKNLHSCSAAELAIYFWLSSVHMSPLPSNLQCPLVLYKHFSCQGACSVRLHT